MSNFNLVQINPFVSCQWDDAVQNSLSPQFFHQSCWLKSLVDTYKLKPFCFMISDIDYCTIPMIIVRTLSGKKKAVALPFSDSCDIQCNNINSDEITLRLLSVAKEEGLDRVEFNGTNHFKPSGEPSYSYYGHILHLSKDEILLWKNLSSSKQRNIKKAQREDITVTFHNDDASVREFYRLHCITRKRHGLPPQPVRFFDSIYENIILKNAGEIALASSKNITIAGALFLFCKSEVYFKYGASDKNLQYARANDFLMWKAINRYAKKEMKILSFGKTEIFHEGLARFKEGFGASRILLSDHIYDVSKGKKLEKSPNVHGVHNKIFELMPVPLLRLCGELLYKYAT